MGLSVSYIPLSGIRTVFCRQIEVPDTSLLMNTYTVQPQVPVFAAPQHLLLPRIARRCWTGRRAGARMPGFVLASGYRGCPSRWLFPKSPIPNWAPAPFPLIPSFLSLLARPKPARLSQFHLANPSSQPPAQRPNFQRLNRALSSLFFAPTSVPPTAKYRVLHLGLQH